LTVKGQLVAAVAALACVSVLFATQFSAPGPGMDEGILVAYPTLVQEGEVPGRDFESFYGPGMPYVGAAAFEAFGSHVWIERAIGLLLRLIIFGAVYALLLYWGRLPALVGLGISALVALPLGLSATSWFAALALVLLGLAIVVRAPRRSALSRDPRLVLIAGVVSGLAIAFRPDMAVAALLPAGILLYGTSDLRRFITGFIVGALPTLCWAVVVGPSGMHRLLSDLSASRPGRALPLPAFSTSDGQVLIAIAAVTATLLAIGAIRLFLRREVDLAARLSLALGLLCLALFPAALERADEAHTLASGCVVLGLAPAAVLELWQRRWRNGSLARVAAVAVGALVAIGSTHAAGPTAKTAMLELGPRESAYDVVSGDRSFPISSRATAISLSPLLARLNSLSGTGDRVFVGPENLRLTNYSDSFIYYLLPDLRPASFYTELNSGAANASGSGLSDDLRSSDFLLLTTRYDDWDEPNSSRDTGAASPLHVVEENFCPVAREGSYRLLRRC
jgi:hypothetical protein